MVLDFFFSTLHTCLKVVFHFDNFLFITRLGTKRVWKKELEVEGKGARLRYASSYRRNSQHVNLL